MYLWKCWRDTRRNFFLFLIALVALALLMTFGNIRNYGDRANGWSLVDSGAPAVARDAWTKTEKELGLLVGALAVIVGLVLGASGVGAEFGIGTLPFLVTLPRRRRYFVWVNWLTGAAQLLALFVVSVGVAFWSLLFVTGSVGSWRLLAIIPLTFTIALATYGLAYLMTVLTRSSQNGLVSAIVLGIGCNASAGVVSHLWKINLPSLAGLLRFYKMGGESFPLGAMVEFLLIAMAFPFAAQLLFEHAEV